MGRRNSDAIKKAVKILQSKKYIKKTESNKWKDNEDQVLGVTKTGLEFTLEFYSPEEFWKMCFYLFDEKNQSKFNLHLDPKEIFDRYEQFILNITEDNYIPSYFIRNINELKTLSLNKPIFPFTSPSIPAILDSIGYRESSTLSEIYSDLKVNYPKIYDHFTCVDCKRKYPDFHRIIHKDMDLLEEALKMLIQDYYIYEIESNNVKKYSLLHSGLLLLLYYLFRDLDKKELFSLDQLRKGLDEENLTPGQRGLKQRILLILKNYEKLLPVLFSREGRNFLGINDYYILHIMLMIYFESQNDFLLKVANPHYQFLSVCRDIMEQKFQNNITNYHDSGRRVLKCLINNRENETSFCSDLSEDYFEKKQKQNKKFLKNSRKQYKTLFKYNKKPKNIQPDKTYFSINIISDAELIIKLKEKKIPKRKFNKYLKYLPSETDLQIFERVLPVLKELIKVGTNYHRSRSKSDNMEDIYNNDFKKIQNKITFDFLLLYSHLEKEKWNVNFSKLPIKKWHLEKIQRIIDFSNTQQQEILKKIKEN